MKKELQNQIIIYEDRVEVRFEDETVWLSQGQLVELFQSSKANISEHIKNIYEEKELAPEATVRNFRIVQKEGIREVSRDIEHYNLDLIISLGYRVKSHVATKFRQWATARLKEYMIKGFALDSDRLKSLGGGHYWKELLDEIRDIRSSEKVLYRQVLDLYATAMDYDPQAGESLKFFKIVQNKLHFAAHGHTAAEVIYLRVDNDKPFAGLATFKGTQPTQAEAMVAKNFLELKELKVLNNLVSAYFDLAEINALEERPMKMADHIRELDNILKSTGRKVLEDAGKVSHEKAMEKAKLEYKKYKAKNLSEVEKEYLENIKTVEKKVVKKVREKTPKSKK
ncbi:cell filamentation protein Fic [Candidatus Peregrinibacteria bacterium CG_4_10_14_0_2_um_filter_43_11]|nr:MAG: cell filamentation protein Fic [Candidatus Peregrinibacteria bacterium CG_4_10_14_0_2_um_filter_43_11]